MSFRFDIDADLATAIENEANYWREVKRVISTIKFLAERGLAFRGENQTPNSPKNGNFFGILELIAEFDPFLAKHITEKAIEAKVTNITCHDL